jgi:hypothetical protein
MHKLANNLKILRISLIRSMLQISNKSIISNINMVIRILNLGLIKIGVPIIRMSLFALLIKIDLLHVIVWCPLRDRRVGGAPHRNTFILSI